MRRLLRKQLLYFDDNIEEISINYRFEIGTSVTDNRVIRSGIIRFDFGKAINLEMTDLLFCYDGYFYVDVFLTNPIMDTIFETYAFDQAYYPLSLDFRLTSEYLKETYGIGAFTRVDSMAMNYLSNDGYRQISPKIGGAGAGYEYRATEYCLKMSPNNMHTLLKYNDYNSVSIQHYSHKGFSNAEKDNLLSNVDKIGLDRPHGVQMDNFTIDLSAPDIPSEATQTRNVNGIYLNINEYKYFAHKTSIYILNQTLYIKCRMAYFTLDGELSGSIRDFTKSASINFTNPRIGLVNTAFGACNDSECIYFAISLYDYSSKKVQIVFQAIPYSGNSHYYNNIAPSDITTDTSMSGDFVVVNDYIYFVFACPSSDRKKFHILFRKYTTNCTSVKSINTTRALGSQAQTSGATARIYKSFYEDGAPIILAIQRCLYSDNVMDIYDSNGTRIWNGTFNKDFYPYAFYTNHEFFVARDEYTALIIPDRQPIGKSWTYREYKSETSLQIDAAIRVAMYGSWCVLNGVLMSVSNGARFSLIPSVISPYYFGLPFTHNTKISAHYGHLYPSGWLIDSTFGTIPRIKTYAFRAQ